MSLVAKLLRVPTEEIHAAEDAMRRAERKQDRGAQAAKVERARVVNIVADVCERTARLSSAPPRPLRSPSTIDPAELDGLELEDAS